MPQKKGDERTVEIARMGGRASGRWKGKDPATVRNKQIRITVTEDERDMIERLSAATSLSKTELIVRAVAAYEADQAEELPF